MLDLALFGFWVLLMLLGLRRPFIWVLAYLYIDILAPQKIGWSLIQLAPISLVAFIAAVAGWLVVDRKADVRVGWRQALIVLLMVYAGWTTMGAEFPIAAAEKWSWVWRALVFALFLSIALTTRLRLEAALLTIVLTAGAIIVSAGIKTALGGGGYGQLYLFVNDNTNIYESSTLATVAIGIIPLTLWLVKHGTIFPDSMITRGFAAVLIVCALLVPIGTEARTGLLCIAMLAVLMLRQVKRPLLFVIAAGVLGLAALPFLPQSYQARMETLTNPGEDESASTRVQVWQWTIDYARDNPLGGGFDSFRANRFTYEMPVEEVEGSVTRVEMQKIVDEGRAFHSAIFEMLGEQGWPGLILWLLLQGSGLVQMERLKRRWRDRPDPADRWQAPLAGALQNAQIIYLVGALFQGIAYQPVFLAFIAMQIALAHHCARRESAVRARRRKAVRDEIRGARTASPQTDHAMP